MKTISILTPSRNRPQRLDTFVRSIYETADKPERIEILNYIDNDDPAINEYKKYEDTYVSELYELLNFRNLYGPPISVSKSWNEIAKMSLGDILIMGNDDLIYRTKYWDTTLENELRKYPDNVYCAWFEDKINGPKHCAFPIISRTWYDTVGYFAPGVFNFGYNDTWVFDIAKKVGRTHFIKDVVVEHMHFSKQKAEFDDTYARNRTQEKGNLYTKDKVIFEETDKLRQEDADKLKDIIKKSW